MIEFSFFQIFQYLSLLIAIACFKGLKAFRIQSLIAVILLSCVSDFLGSLDLKVFNTKNNYWIFNYYLILSTPLYAWMFNSMLKRIHRLPKAILIAELMVFIFTVFNYLFLEGKDVFNSFSLIVTQLLFILLSCITLMQLALQENIQPSFLKHPYCWISIGTLLFSLGAVVILGLQRYISANQLKFGDVNIYGPVMAVLNIILFSLYSYASILCPVQKNKLSQPSLQS